MFFGAVHLGELTFMLCGASDSLLLQKSAGKHHYEDKKLEGVFAERKRCSAAWKHITLLHIGFDLIQCAPASSFAEKSFHYLMQSEVPSTDLCERQ